MWVFFALKSIARIENTAFSPLPKALFIQNNGQILDSFSQIESFVIIVYLSLFIHINISISDETKNNKKKDKMMTQKR